MLVTRKQLVGAAVIAAITSGFLFCILLMSDNHVEKKSIQYSNKNFGNNIVEISANVGIGGVYFLPEDITIREVFLIAGIGSLQNFDQQLLEMKIKNGSTIYISSDNCVEIREMSNAKRLHFELPIEINMASADDLMLIPGIGEKIAWRIVEYRQKHGLFQNVEDLMRIEGIKEKKYIKLRKYFYVDKLNANARQKT